MGDVMYLPANKATEHRIRYAVFDEFGRLVRDEPASSGLYLTRGDGVAVPETAQRLADAINAAGIAMDCTADEAAAMVAKLLEADHG